MKKRLIPYLIILLTGTMQVSFAQPQEIHCKHFLYGYPVGTPTTNDLIIRDIYALSSNDDTKMADWVAYRLDKHTVNGHKRLSRHWKADPWLDSSETLEPNDYESANFTLNVDRGHQAPLASFKGTHAWRETNFLSNITPQKPALNQGPWRRLEDKVRRYVKKHHRVLYVITGPLYEMDMTELPSADEPHKVPSGYWKIVAEQPGTAESLRMAAFIFQQDTPRDSVVAYHLTTVREVERRSNLDFFRLLPDALEHEKEQDDFKNWIADQLLK